VWQGIKNGAIAVSHAAVDLIKGIVQVVIDIGGAAVKVFGALLDGAQAAARAAESVFRQVVADIGKVVDWLKSVFAFEDIWQTKTVLADGVSTVLSYGLATVKHFNKLADKWVEDQWAAAQTYYAQLRTDYQNRPLGDARNQLPPLTDASGVVLPPNAIRDDPQGGWLAQQMTSPAALAAALRAEEAEEEVELSAGVLAVADAWETFLGEVKKNGVVEEAAKLFHDLHALVSSISDPADPAGTSKSSMIGLIDALESLTRLALTAVQALLGAVVKFAEDVHAALPDLLGQQVPGFEPLAALYEWIQGEAGVAAADVEKLSVGGLAFLAAAFPVTVGYKLLNGPEEGPFPHGFPALKPPPWHPDHDPDSAVAIRPG
jgi:hypothetical protein